MAGYAPRGTARVDVVIPTFDARELVLECLTHLDDPVIADRIVVDDASRDGTAAAVGARFPEAKVEALDAHRGLAHALNAGAGRGEAPYLLFINNDVFAEPGSVARLVEALESDPSAASAGGRLLDSRTGATQDAYRPRAFPTIGTLAVRLFGLERVRPRNRWSGAHLREPLDDDAVVRVDQPAGACLLVRRDAFERVGGWDEGYPFWYEDVDLSRRLSLLGHALWVGPARFRHLGTHSTSGWSKPEQHRRLYRGTLRYSRGHLTRVEATAVAVSVAVVCLLRIPLYLVKRDPAAIAVYRGLAREAVGALRAQAPGPGA